MGGKYSLHLFEHTTRRPFTFSFYKKNYELIPLVCVCTFGVSQMTFMGLRTCFNSDCIITRWSKKQVELIELLDSPRVRKLIPFYDEFTPNPEVANTYREMKAACEQRKKEDKELIAQKGTC